MEYVTINNLRLLLHSDHDFTKNEPNRAHNGCDTSTKGISVSVINLFIGVHDLRGFVSHNNISTNCIPHHPTIIKPIHLKCGTFDLIITTMATKESNVVLALDSTL